MKRGLLWTLLLSLFGMGGLWSVHAITFNSSSYSVNGSIGDSISGGQNSTNYKLTSAGGASIAGTGSSGSYKLGQGYVPSLENAMQVNVQPNGLIGYYSMDQGSGTTVVDDSVNSSPGTFQGAPTWTAGKIGSAISGYSTSDYVSINNDAVFNVSAVSTCVWENEATVTTNPMLVTRASGVPTNDGMWTIGFNGGQTPRARIMLGGTVYLVTSNAALPLSSWHHLCFTWGSNTLILYVDGVETARTTTSGSMSSMSYPVAIGTTGSGSQPFDGSIDEVKIFSRTLSAAEIKAEYDGQNAGLSSGVSLNTITPGVSQTASFDSIIQTSSPGYTLAINQNNNLTRSGGGTIAGVSGSIAAPVSWNEGVTKGLGFTLYGTNATAIPGLWGSGAGYAAIPGSATSFYNRNNFTGGGKDVLNMRLRLDTTASQAGGDYTNKMIITGTMKP
jgi:hypothetical protein